MTRERADVRLWDRLGFFLLPLVGLIAVLPLIRNGCSCGHDFDFHITSWMEAAAQFGQGNLHPHWAFTPAYNAGEPRFVFYPPLSWTIGGVLGLVLPWAMTPIVYTWLALTAAGLGCYRMLRDFAEASTALMIAALYMVNPYMLFTAYERTAYAELLAAAWLPLLLLGVLRKRVTVMGIAVPTALLWMSNAPAAVIGCYGLAVLAGVRLIVSVREGDASAMRPMHMLRNTMAGTALGLGLASFYVVPAAYERRYVQIAMAMTDGMRIADNFLFHRTPDADHDAVLRSASLLAVGLLLLTAATLGIAFVRSRKVNADRPTLWALAVLTAVIALLVTPASAMIWSHAPELAFLQFPWRFLTILMPVLALAIALAIDSKRWANVVGMSTALVLGVVLTFAAYEAYRQGCDAEDTVAARVALFHSPAGTEPTDEYTPITADNDVLGRSNPPFWLAGSGAGAAPAGATGGSLRWPLDLVSPGAQVLILNLRDYPAWRVSVNHRLITERLQRADGLIAIPVTAGVSHVAIVYARTADEAVGEAITAISLIGLVVLWRRGGGLRAGSRDGLR